MPPRVPTPTLAAEVGTYGRRIRTGKFCLNADSHGTSRDHLHAENLRHGTHSFTSLPKEGVLRIFSALKNPTASAGFEPANLGTRGQHANPTPPKPLTVTVTDIACVLSRSSLFWDVLQPGLAVSYRRFASTNRSHLQGPCNPFFPDCLTFENSTDILSRYVDV
jgi:hypothetical protein